MILRRKKKSGSQKVLRVFGVFELLIAAFYVYFGMAGESVAEFVSAALYLLAAILLFIAAKDATKAGGAWLITLVDLILSLVELLFALNGESDAIVFIGGGIAIVLNLIAFIAANIVKRQGKQQVEK